MLEVTPTKWHSLKFSVSDAWRAGSPLNGGSSVKIGHGGSEARGRWAGDQLPKINLQFTATLVPEGITPPEYPSLQAARG